MEPLERIYDVDYEPFDSDSVRGSDSSDDGLEDFENEMQEELDRRVGIDRKKTSQASTSAKKSVKFSDLENNQSTSGSAKDAPEGAKQKSRTAEEEANDEAFYDPDEDEDNERWAQRQRQKHIFPNATKGEVQALPNSDAVLNCPGCMTVLCRDCQAHETISGRYRAMFVCNCEVKTTETVPGPLMKNRSSKKRRRGERDAEVDSDENSVFHPCHCSFCHTRVGVVDSDEVYHFLYVLAS